MSKLEELINKLCPNGVRFVTLADAFDEIKGMSGVSNKWKDEGNCRFIDYLNVYKHMSVDVLDLPFATVQKLDQDKLQKGDILFTSASETPDECAIEAAIEKDIVDGVFLDDHLFGLRPNLDYKNIFNTGFLKHYFRSESFRKDILKAVRGVTRFYIAKPAFMKLVIPVPPIEVQCEIARILDSFTELTAELTAELIARRKQYEFYKEQLMINSSIEIKKIGDVCNVTSGGTPSKTKAEFWEGGTIKWLGSTVCQNTKEITEITGYITEKGLSHSSAKIVKPGTTLVAMVGATIGKTAYLTFEATTNQNIACLFPKNTNQLDCEFLYYSIQMLYPHFYDLGAGKLAIASLSFIKGLEIPLPSIYKQKEIVKILNNFESISNSIKDGLPAEIEARQKQYEYYRDKLLEFKELKA